MSLRHLEIAIVLQFIVTTQFSQATTITVYDRVTAKEVPNATIYIEVESEKGYRTRVDTLKANENGIFDTERTGSLVARCEEKITRDGISADCHQLVITAEKGNKSGEAHIKWNGTSWQPVQLSIQIAMQASTSPPVLREKMYWHFIPIFEEVQGSCQYCSLDSSGATRPVLVTHQRIVAVRVERVPASMVPIGANVSLATPEWALPFVNRGGHQGPLLSSGYCSEAVTAPACGCNSAVITAPW